MNDSDNELMELINAHADKAEKAKPAMIDALAYAEVLHANFQDRNVEEIRQKIKTVWRMRGLHWLESKKERE